MLFFLSISTIQSFFETAIVISYVCLRRFLLYLDSSRSQEFEQKEVPCLYASMAANFQDVLTFLPLPDQKDCVVCLPAYVSR